MKDEKLFCVYIVANRSRVLYVGVTSDLYQRVQQHRKGIYERFTSRYACNRLVWFERFTGPNEAIRAGEADQAVAQGESHMGGFSSRLGIADPSLFGIANSG